MDRSIPLLLSVLFATSAFAQAPALVTGLDHIIILVNDVEAAAGRYRAMRPRPAARPCSCRRN